MSSGLCQGRQYCFKYLLWYDIVESDESFKWFGFNIRPKIITVKPRHSWFFYQMQKKRGNSPWSISPPSNILLVSGIIYYFIPLIIKRIKKMKFLAWGTNYDASEETSNFMQQYLSRNRFPCDSNSDYIDIHSWHYYYCLEEYSWERAHCCRWFQLPLLQKRVKVLDYPHSFMKTYHWNLYLYIFFSFTLDISAASTPATSIGIK